MLSAGHEQGLFVILRHTESNEMKEAIANEVIMVSISTVLRAVLDDDLASPC